MSVNGFDINGTIVKYDYNELDNAPIVMDSNGDGVFAGKLTVGTAPSANMDVATKSYVDTVAAPEIFWATYDVTTNAEIDAAYQAGKVVCCLRNSRVYILAYCVSSTKHTFAATTPTQVWGLHCENNVWSTENRAIGAPSPNLPQPLGTAAIGTSLNFARADHVHENNQFWATYGTTTNAEIEAAYQAGKICAVSYSDKVYYLTSRVSDTRHVFLAPTLGALYRVECSANAWATSTKVNASASSATPSALGTAAAGSSSDFARADHVHENNQFWATYNVTTAAEIKAAYDAGKEIFVRYGSGNTYFDYRLTRVFFNTGLYASGNFTFSVFSYGAEKLVLCRDNAAGTTTTWSASSDSYALEANYIIEPEYTDETYGHPLGSMMFWEYDLMTDYGKWIAKVPNEEVTVATDGDVSQALDPGKMYHFTGTLTSLTITLTAASAGQTSQYHFDFNCGSTAPTVTIPNTITMPSGNTFDASKHYEVDILNNYGVVASWATS